MTAPGTDVILKILKQMSFSLMNGNKIAIHCHAGRGRTGLIIAAWLIYHNNMTAKEAIKHVRSKRKGCIQSKSQEQILFKLDKEIRESRMIFHSTPKFKLEDFLFHQKKLLPLSRESQVRFVPNLVLITIERLETLINSKVCSPLGVALSFYSPNDSVYFKTEWTAYHEKSLKAYKEKINSGDLAISEIDDPRILVQGLLDYFDGFSVAAVRNQFIDAVHNQIHNQDKLTREMKDNFFKSLDRKEFLLVECFAKFFSALIGDDQAVLTHVRKAIFRLCISLILERKRWDKLFLKRSVIQEHSGEDRVTYLNVFMLKWIENFSQSFTENYMMANSPLGISVRSVKSKLSSRLTKRGTYMERLISNPESPSTDQTSSPALSQTPLSSRLHQHISPEPKVNTPRTKNESTFSKQAQLEARIKSRTALDAGILPETPELHINLPSSARTLQDHQLDPIPNPASESQSKFTFEASSITAEDGSPSKRSTSMHHPKIKVHSEKASDSSPASRKGHLSSSSFSPARHKGLSFIEPRRISFLNPGSHPFVNNEKDGAKTSTIHRNYDDFFTANAVVAEEMGTNPTHPTEENDRNNEQADQESQSSQSSTNLDFDDLLKRIDGLTSDQHDIIIERLLKKREAKKL